MTNKYIEEFSAVETRPDKRQLTRKLVILLKTGRPCTDCNEIFPHYMMDFDHVKGVKLGNIESIARRGKLGLLIEEVGKCELVCANCHRHRTWLNLAGKERKSIG